MDLFYLVWIFCEFVESIVGGVVIAILVAIALIIFGIYSLVTYNPDIFVVRAEGTWKVTLK